MKKFISYPKIKQYRNVIKDINNSASYIGYDEEANLPIFDILKPKPILKFEGTVKLHGTCASVCYNENSGLWTQSRKNIITPEKDNAGFFAFVHSKKDIFLNLIESINHYKNNEIISIFGEWCGSGIQKGVGINKLPKMFVIFGLKITTINEDAFWLPIKDLHSKSSHSIYNINDFPTFEIDIDFNRPKEFQNQLNDFTQKVEEECPVAAHFGIKNGTGEGIVWATKYKDNHFRFKVKGEVHSNSKIKKLPKVDDNELALINDIVNKITPPWRLEQGIQEIFDLNNDGEINRNKLGDYIRWVIKDIIDEDLDIITNANLELKKLNPIISKVARDYFFNLEQS